MPPGAPSYGAAERGQGGQDSGQAASVRAPMGQARVARWRLLLAGGAVAAAVLCAASLAAGASAAARVEAAAVWPAGALGQSALGSVLDEMRPGAAPQQVKYGYINAKTPHYDSYLREQANYLHNQQELGLSPALNRARQSQRDMSSLVNYYAQRSPAANPDAYTVAPPAACALSRLLRGCAAARRCPTDKCAPGLRAACSRRPALSPCSMTTARWTTPPRCGMSTSST